MTSPPDMAVPTPDPSRPARDRRAQTVTPAAGLPRWFGGKYILLKELGHGGMARVFLAAAAGGTPGLCALKTLRQRGASDDLGRRFLDELRLVSRLSNESLARVLDAGIEGGDCYLAMEYIQGKSLAQVWDRCAQRGLVFPLGVAMHVSLAVTAALAYAHSFEKLGLVHRDVAPSNVMLSYDGAIKLIDFGIAKWKHKASETAAGVQWGRMSYKAPEQLLGEPADRRSDIFSAGVIFWEMLAGRQLFPDAERRPLANEIPPPSVYNKVVPPELDEVALKATAQDPDRRYQTAEQFNLSTGRYLAPGEWRAMLADFLRQIFADEIAEENDERERLTAVAARLRELGPPPARAALIVPAADPLVGKVLLDRYEIRRLVGRGSMGAVYEGYHRGIAKRVAIKVPNADEANPAIVERLRVEALAAGQLQHQNIAGITDSGTTTDGAFFFVMEYLDGANLDEVIQADAPLLLERALSIALQVCRAVDAAHRAGVVHRDLKPSNVMLIEAPDGTELVKVLDFGLAKFLGPQPAAAEPVNEGLTRPEAVVGTPHYMAPEQIEKGAVIDTRADIYAVGVLLYEMLTGRLPFEGDDVIELCQRKLTASPLPIGQLRPELPKQVQDLVMSALSFDRERRPGAASEIARVLETLLAGFTPGAIQHTRSPSTTAIARPPLSRARRLTVALGAATVGAAGLAITWFLLTQGRAGTESQSLPVQEAASRTEAAGAPSRSPPAPRPVAPAPAAPEPAPATASSVTRPQEPAPAPATKALRPAGPGRRQGRPPAAPLPSRATAPVQPDTPAARAPVANVGALLGQAEESFQAGDLPAATMHARRALQVGGGVEAHLMLGKILLFQRRTDEARQQYQRVLELDPGNPAALRALKLAETPR